MRTITTFTQSLPQGISLCCRAAGAPDARRRVLLLHGFPEGAFAWDGVLAALASEARVLAPDLRGYGHSSAPPGVAAYRAKHGAKPNYDYGRIKSWVERLPVSSAARSAIFGDNLRALLTPAKILI